jgi:hypothetical protein
MKNYKCSCCKHVACVGCVEETWLTAIPQTGGTYRPFDATANLVCCQCKENKTLDGWVEIKVTNRKAPTRITYPDLFETTETKI